jgi:hypothetical protein
MSSEPKRTSHRLRLAALAAISDLKRPLAAPEIEAWIRAHDPILGTELQGKCYDYTRMILSLAQAGTFQILRLARTVKGIDRRSSFYGLPNLVYDSSIWTSVAPKPVKKATQRKPDKRRTRQTPLPRDTSTEPDDSQSTTPPCLPDPPADPTNWMALTTFADRNDPFWPTLMEGMGPAQPEATLSARPDDLSEPAMAVSEPRGPVPPLEEALTPAQQDGRGNQEEAWISDIVTVLMQF